MQSVITILYNLKTTGLESDGITKSHINGYVQLIKIVD